MKAISLLQVCSLAALLAIPGLARAQGPGPAWGWALAKEPAPNVWLGRQATNTH